VRALRRALGFIAIAIGVVVITAGFIMWAVDRENFPDPGEGMWWAVQTATTIGYGDVVPTTAAGRAVASLVMILGVAFVSILTAFIVSDLVARHAERQQKEIEQEELDITAAIGRLDERLARIEGVLGAGPPQEPRSPST
jgi:voltage-gated potassium channel